MLRKMAAGRNIFAPVMKSYANILIIPALVTLLMSCSVEERPRPSEEPCGDRLAVGLRYYEFGDGTTRTKAAATADYDRVELLVADDAGTVVGNIKAYYEKRDASVYIEGIRPGDYRLMIAGVRGDADGDGVSFAHAGSVSDVWISFPEGGVVGSEYFYSSTAFSVWPQDSPDGVVMVSDLPETITQERIIGRLDMTLNFRNQYTEWALLSAVAVLESPAFYTGLTVDGTFAGTTDGRAVTLDLMAGRSCFMVPTVEGGGSAGQVETVSRTYVGETVRREYGFTVEAVRANHITSVSVDPEHPDDGSGTMFITDKAYAAGGHGLILQDDEPYSIYTDKTLRNFNTARPLQVSVTGDELLSVRFYSPKPLEDVLIRARIPSVGNEYVDLAYFDSIPAFADFYGEIPALSAPGVYRTESGRIVELPQLTAAQLSDAEFRIVSGDPYWDKLSRIEHGWNIRFDLFGGDPTQADGKPQGNWMGIRPVHCREAVAFFLNFTYMIDMPEHEEILRANQDRLYGNGGVDDKVPVETVLAQMRQQRTINVGLVYPGNGVVGLGGGSTFGAWQAGWLEHYTSAYACEVMFHELGHVMGYSHSSSFTYGPWAQELMNNFYINHLSEMPVESPHWLNSKANPSIYQ